MANEGSGTANLHSITGIAIAQDHSKIKTLTEKLEALKSRIAQLEKQQREELAKERRLTKLKERALRTRLLSHFGGIGEMCGLLQYRFIGSSRRDNIQDDLRANLLAGALLDLAQRLSIASEQELLKLSKAGQAYRAQRPAARQVPPTNPLIALGEVDDEQIPIDET